MVMFCLMTKRVINLVRLILDYILLNVNAKRKSHATLPYGLFLIKVFIRAQLPIEGHRTETKRPTTTIKTFSTLGLKPQTQEKKKENKKEKKQNDPFEQKCSIQKVRSKPSEEKKKKKKKTRKKSLTNLQRKESQQEKIVETC